MQIELPMYLVTLQFHYYEYNQTICIFHLCYYLIILYQLIVLIQLNDADQSNQVLTHYL